MNKNGFSLIELLVTMAIIGILSALALFGTQGVREQGRDAKRRSDLESIRSGLETFRSDCNSYPATLTFGGSLNGTGAITACAAGNLYIARIPVDPQNPTRTYTYRRISTNRYALCANMEVTPNPPANASDLAQCTACAGTGGCDYVVLSP